MGKWDRLREALEEISKGGPGSGHRGHVGRPGLRGGGQAGPGGGLDQGVPILEEGLPKRNAETSNAAHLERGASSPEQREVFNLGGGVCQSFKVKIKDDGKACYKPDDLNTYTVGYNQFNDQSRLMSKEELKDYVTFPMRDRSPIRRDFDENIPMSLREQAVHNIDRGLGFNVTPAMVVKDFGKGRGSALSWVEGKFDVGDKKDDYLSKDVEKIAALDFIVGNSDRHTGNILRGDDGRFYAPDNGLSFPGKRVYSQVRSAPIQMMASTKYALSTRISPKIKEAVNRFDEPKIRKAMKGFGEPEIKGVLRRRKRFLASDNWRDIASRMARGDSF